MRKKPAADVAALSGGFRWVVERGQGNFSITLNFDKKLQPAFDAHMKRFGKNLMMAKLIEEVTKHERPMRE